MTSSIPEKPGKIEPIGPIEPTKSAETTLKNITGPVLDKKIEIKEKIEKIEVEEDSPKKAGILDYLKNLISTNDKTSKKDSPTLPIPEALAAPSPVTYAEPPKPPSSNPKKPSPVPAITPLPELK